MLEKLGAPAIHRNSAPDLYDLVVTHEPFSLEAKTRFDTHYFLRRQNGNLEMACEFPGDATVSSSQGAGAISTTRRITIERVPRAAPFTFAVQAVESVTTQNRQDGPISTTTIKSVKQYELPAAGMCRER